MKILILIALVFLFFFILFKLKIPKCGNMVLVTGGIKTGKTALSVHMALKTLKKQRIKVVLKNYVIRPILNFVLFPFLNLFRKKENKLKKIDKLPYPQIYSNVPLKVPYISVTLDLLQRQERFIYKSVCYLCESSLVADSMTYKDDFINEQLLLFSKLFAHETKGGYLFLDTQSISDNHYAFKRCLSSYFYIHDTNKKIPFFLVMHVREMKYSDDNNAVNAVTEDLESSLKTVIVPKSVWKKYDCYCYSILTDSLPVNDSLKIPESLKADKIISFKKFKNLYGGIKNNENTKKN